MLKMNCRWTLVAMVLALVVIEAMVSALIGYATMGSYWWGLVVCPVLQIILMVVVTGPGESCLRWMKSFNCYWIP